MDDDTLLGQPSQPTNKKRNVCICALLIVIIVVGTALAINYSSSSSESETFAKSIKVDNMMGHINQLYAISKNFPTSANPAGSRAVATGYNASAEYVMEQLAVPHLTVAKQFITTPVWVQNKAPTLVVGVDPADPVVSFIEGVDFQNLRYGGNGTGTLELEFVAVNSFGCNMTDYVNTTGKFCLVADCTCCDYFQKTYTAQLNGCAAVVIYRTATGSKSLSSNRARKTGWLKGDPLVTIPSMSSTWSFFQIINSNPDFIVKITFNNTLTLVDTWNIIAETTGGDASRVVLYGSHLDGVPQGPGMNDNGSGSSMNLELALNFAKKYGKDTKNKVRFAWWGAEEDGLLGSYWYVSQLSPAEQANILCAFNFDMMASPNGVRLIYNGTDSPSSVTDDIKQKSWMLTQKFIDQYEKQGVPYYFNSMAGGGSDFYPFIISQIPTGATATGASNARTTAQRDAEGGIANAAYDPCYHQLCDTPANINQVLYQSMADAAAGVLYDVAMDSKLFK